MGYNTILDASYAEKEMIVEKKEQLLARFANFFEDKYYRDL
jgi:hypothetical protein